ncbi:MAG: arginine N-succinyltransferase [Planctomycetota bacterium]
MFVIRQAILDDLPTLLKLAKMVHFINLPADKDLLSAKISRSRRSFAGDVDDIREREFMFVLEDGESNEVVGTCSILCCVSWEGRPHIYLRTGKRSFYSEDLQLGQTHTTLELGTDTSGPSEVGGLILAPGFRGRPERLGSLLSLVRFHFMGLHREMFADRILAEMMGPLTPDSGTLLWEYLGRRFINLSYKEADLFSSRSKEFLLSLWPKGEIYASLLPPEARALIGRVGDETEPAKRMLEKQGFKYHGHVDPFDGGPYLDVATADVPLVKATASMRLGAVREVAGGAECFASHKGRSGFRAVRSAYLVEDGRLVLPQATVEALGVPADGSVGFTPLPESKSKPRRAKKA